MPQCLPVYVGNLESSSLVLEHLSQWPSGVSDLQWRHGTAVPRLLLKSPLETQSLYKQLHQYQDTTCTKSSVFYFRIICICIVPAYILEDCYTRKWYALSAILSLLLILTVSLNTIVQLYIHLVSCRISPSLPERDHGNTFTSNISRLLPVSFLKIFYMVFYIPHSISTVYAGTPDIMVLQSVT